MISTCNVCHVTRYLRNLGLAAALPAMIAGAACATQGPVLPDLFDVADVAVDDVLNIREQPSASAPVIGELAHDATGIEAVAERDGWLQINSGERAGWVNGRYLAIRQGVWPDAGLPATLSCYGNEPFWGLKQDGGQMVLSNLGGSDQSAQVEAVLSSGAPLDLRRVIMADDLTAVITPNECNDGMSDRNFALEAIVILGRGASAQMLSGCCSIAEK